MAASRELPTDGQQKEDFRGEHTSQLELFWKEFRRDTLSVLGGLLILAIIFIAIFAPHLAPYDPTAQFEHPEGVYHPLPPGTTLIMNERSVGTALLGTDHFGRDILSRAIYGTRTLMTIAFGVLVWSFSLGVIVGAVAGYYKETKIDEILMRFMDLLFAFPSLVLAIAVIGALGPGPTDLGFLTLPTEIKVIIALGLFPIPAFARVMRGAVLKDMEEDYITAAKAQGASDGRIITKELAINTIPVVIVQATLYMGGFVLDAAALSFLGLGIQPPNASLGLMLAQSRNYLYGGNWWYATVPGLAIFIAIMGLNLMGDGLRDALDPRYTKEGSNRE